MICQQNRVEPQMILWTAASSRKWRRILTLGVIFVLSLNRNFAINTELFFQKHMDNISVGVNDVTSVSKYLETLRGKQYFAYDNEHLTLPHIRQKAYDPNSKPTWGAEPWAKRFEPYALGELRYYEKLESNVNPDLRTFNIQVADFVLVPIPVGAAIFWGNRSDIQQAFQYLFQHEPFFEAHPEKHAYISTIERLFRSSHIDKDHFRECCGIISYLRSKIKKGIMVRDFDAINFTRYLLKNPNNDWNNREVILETRPTFHHYWSLGYAHECSDSTYPFIDLDELQNWYNKSLVFFYHTTTETSLYNSTVYRHALVKGNESVKLLQPSSVGYNIKKYEWHRNLIDSKYCIVIRGDNPSSRIFFTAIRVGCLPVIVSDVLPYYQPMFRSLLRYDDFAIQIDEAVFLSDPAESLNNAISALTEADLRKKIRGLALLQRMLVLDHPQSLFVPSFVHETVARQREYLIN